jgi:enoyl-CoA hydratase
MSPELTTLSLSIDGHVAEVALNRPDRANSMSADMWRELQHCFEWLDAQDEVRAVILTGNGKHFCAGMDLEVFAQSLPDKADPARRAEAFRRYVLELQGNLTALEACRKPVLAAIHNTCIGGAIDLVCCCDMRYATEDAWFSVREVDIGMVADVGTLQRLPKLIPDGVARELAYTGRNMDAEEAREVGFVNRVFEHRDAMLREVRNIARTIAAKSPLVIRGTKEQLLYTRDHSVADGLNHVATWNAGMLSAIDLEEGISAQAAGRAARYED